MNNHDRRKRAVPLSHFGRINTNYDPDEPLAKPKDRWWTDAACRHVAVEDRDDIFFPVRQNQRLEQVYAEAATYCKRCPVKAKCLEAALTENGRHQYGYQGGMNHRDRKALHYQRKALQKMKNSEGQ